MKNSSKNLLLAIILSAIISTPFVANAASEWISTDSIGRFEYDANKDGIPDVAIDSKDVDKINDAENTNATNISNLQSKYNSLITSINTVQSQVNTISSSGTATAKDISTGRTAFIKGNLVTGTMPDNGMQDATLTPSDNSYTVKQGYSSGGKIVVNSGLPTNVISEQATNSNGNKLYYTDATAQVNKDLTKITTTTNSYPVLYLAAISGNLSAGSASWIDGILIKGTGTDNNAFYNAGYIAGQKNNNSNLKISYIYHHHTSSCLKTGTCYVTYSESQSGGKTWITEHHSSCGQAARGVDWKDGSSGYSGNYSNHTHTYQYYGCGKTDGQIESATIVY